MVNIVRKDDPNIQASRNHKDCPCCWTHGIDTDQTEAQGRIGVTFRQLAPWALHEAELKRLADERAERDKAAEEGALQPRRRSTPAPKRDAPTGPATKLGYCFPSLPVVKPIIRRSPNPPGPSATHCGCCTPPSSST